MAPVTVHALGGIALAALLTPVLAQTDIADRLEECGTLQADAARLACYDGLRDGDAGAQDQDDEPQDEPTPFQVTPVADAEGSPEADGDTDAQDQDGEPQDEPTPFQVTPVADAESSPEAERHPPQTDPAASPDDTLEADRPPRTVDSPEAEAAPAVVPAPSSRDAAVDRRRSRPPAEESVDITVVEVRRNLSGLAVFVTADDGIWVQISMRNRRYPRTPFIARVERASMNSHFLVPVDGGIAVRVRRP